MLVRRPQRSGTVLIESAFVYPVLFLIMFGIMLLSEAVFRHQQVAHIAREASRWAAVRGAEYALDRKVSATTPTDVYTNAILPHAVGMRSQELSYEVTWSNNGDQRPVRSEVVNGRVVSVANTVSVTVRSTWNSVLFGTITLSSTSVAIMQY